MKLLVAINPNSLEKKVGICGNILITNKANAQMIQIIESSIFNPFFLIFKTTKIKVKTLAIINTKFNPILYLLLSKWLYQENRNHHSTHVFDSIRQIQI